MNSPLIHFTPKSKRQPRSTTTDTKSFRKNPGERSNNEESSSLHNIMFEKRETDAAWAHGGVTFNVDAEVCK